MTWLPTALSDFAPATFAAVIIAGYLVLGEPFVGWILHRRFEAAVDTVPGARRWLYVRLLVLEWGLVVLVAAVAVVSIGVGLPEFGVRWPDRLGPITVVVVLAVIVLTVLSVRALRTGVLRDAGSESAALRSVGSLLPRTSTERHLFTAVATTAGIAEEVVYRGFGIAVLAALGPALPWWALIVLAGVAFGIAHAYQGVAGILSTGLLGTVLAAVYLDSGSLLVPVLLHAAIDLRFLAVPADVLPRPALSPADADRDLAVRATSTDAQAPDRSDTPRGDTERIEGQRRDMQLGDTRRIGGQTGGTHRGDTQRIDPAGVGDTKGRLPAQESPLIDPPGAADAQRNDIQRNDTQRSDPTAAGDGSA